MAEDSIYRRRCATDDISSGDRARMAELEQGFLAETRIAEADLSLEIEVSFIHIVDGGSGQISAAQRAQQIQVLNDAYAGVGISFTHDEGDVTEVDNAAFFRMGHKSLRERQCKSQNQAIAPERGLNFYTAEPGGNLLGWATFPYMMEGDPEMDGVVMLHTTLPGGGGAPFDLGMTAVHEVAHWLGLYHTFQDGCGGNGDEVDDTPAHAGPNYGKPSDTDHPHNLCPGASHGSECPIHNFMNYVDDDWMWEFTSGQKTRIWAQVGMFRRELFAMAQPEILDEAEFGAQIVW